MKIETAELDTQEIHELLGRAIAPLPVALVSTVGEDGTYNAAPFSLVVPVSWKPPVVMVSFGRRRGEKKDTVRNIEFSRDFVINMMDETWIKPTIQTSADYPRGVDEMKEVGLTALPADKVKSPLVAEAQVSLECRLIHELQLGTEQNPRNIIFGEVLLAHVKDEVWVDGKIEPSRFKAVGRIGSGIYCRTADTFRLIVSPPQASRR